MLHFSLLLISLFLGNRYMYIMAVYMARIAIVALGFFKNLIIRNISSFQLPGAVARQYLYANLTKKSLDMK